MNKHELRKKYKSLRLKLSTEVIEELSLEIANNLLKLDIWENEFYHLFLSIAEQKEVDTEFILHILQGKDKNVVIPRTDIEQNALINYLLTDTTKIKKNRWNIPEPVDGIEITPDKIDVVFVPLLAFDKTGHRIGYGKGYYDKFLSSCKTDIIKIGLSFYEAEDAFEDVYNSDIPLDYCVTPKQVYSF
ncbi:5-formyltetrahydrofolate cyclo-ligase [Zunongwangia endophytica]|uniref:5-formyltetrahydrofolate cyclo-ligase n=1 Tax=Zunongwangia endophytica TaxID=1808945 RepID=A0ABV8H7H6_9FLAO|nr:5-formyltetrahydrofolate cyclo-ligase [Zunongwangia endophytica]MDN3595779.1 5-formyltetrahydrofolate cyclo-ligase [Zunongwangia endophytica]